MPPDSRVERAAAPAALAFKRGRRTPLRRPTLDRRVRFAFGPRHAKGAPLATFAAGRPVGPASAFDRRRQKAGALVPLELALYELQGDQAGGAQLIGFVNQFFEAFL